MFIFILKFGVMGFFSCYNIYLFELESIHAPYSKTQNSEIRELIRYLIIISMKEEKLVHWNNLVQVKN